MKKRIRFFVVFLMLLSILPLSSIVASAVEDDTEWGYVEYQTDASINFEEVIEIVLTNEKTEREYVHRLFWANRYCGNFSVPFGVYSVSVSLLSAKGEEVTGAEVFSSVNKINVRNAQNAVLIDLRVEEITAVEVPEPVVPETEPTASTEPTTPESTPSEGLPEDGGDMEVTEPSETLPELDVETTPSPAEPSEKTPPKKSMLGSLAISVTFLVIVAIVLWIVKKKNNS